MIITTHKQFPNYKRYEIEYEGRPLVMETGKLAELCNSAVLVSYGETTVLVTCTASARPKDGVDYFPLSVDFNEKLYAVGRIPGSFMRREGKPSLPAVLASRLIDLGIKGFWNFTNVELSTDKPDVFFEDVHFVDTLLTLSYRISRP